MLREDLKRTCYLPDLLEALLEGMDKHTDEV